MRENGGVVQALSRILLVPRKTSQSGDHARNPVLPAVMDNKIYSPRYLCSPAELGMALVTDLYGPIPPLCQERQTSHLLCGFPSSLIRDWMVAGQAACRQQRS
jgi:hypothetical protein